MMQSACPYAGRTWNNLRVLQWAADRRFVIVQCLNPKCGVRFSLSVHRINYERESCRSCGHTKPVVDIADPFKEQREVAAAVRAERKEAEHKAAEAEAARKAEEQRQLALKQQQDRDAADLKKSVAELQRRAQNQTAISQIIMSSDMADIQGMRDYIEYFKWDSSDPESWRKAKQYLQSN